MLKSGFAILFVVFFACDCFENLQADYQGTGEDANAEEIKREVRDTDDGITDEDDVYSDATFSDVSQEEDENSPAMGSRQRRRYTFSCAGKVQRKPRGRPRCCGNRAYNAKKKMCCWGKVRRKPRGRPRCCGNRAYNARKKMCCRGKVRSKPKGIPICCGTQAYNLQRFICCAGRVQYNPGSSFTACCGIRAFNDRVGICCAGRINHKPARFYYKCCGFRAYDPARYECRGGEIQRRQYRTGSPASRPDRHRPGPDIAL